MQTIASQTLIDIHRLNLYYGDFSCAEERNDGYPGESDHRVHRAVRLRQVDAASHAQPHERHDRGHAHRRQIAIAGTDIYSKEVDVETLRKKVGMVFQQPNPFPKSIYDNVAYGPRLHGIRRTQKLDEIVETSLRSAALWDEVKDHLKRSALSLSGGQQQRLCIARAIAVNRTFC